MDGIFSVRDEHKEAMARYSHEKPDGEMFSCSACKISSTSALGLWEDCHKNQKERIFGKVRCHSCDMCDVHLSEMDWLEKHMQGEPSKRE